MKYAMEIQMCDPKGFWVFKIAIFMAISKKAEILNYGTTLSCV